jgi:hypothetical protein
MAATPTTGPDNHTRPAVSAADRRAARARRERLHAGLVELEESLTGPTQRREQWLSAVREALASMRETVVDHVAESEGPDGLLEQISDVAPWLGPRVEQLRSEHDDLVAFADELAARARSASEPDEVSDDAWRLLERVSKHRRKGADLLYDAYALDVSAGD